MQWICSRNSKKQIIVYFVLVNNMARKIHRLNKTKGWGVNFYNQKESDLMSFKINPDESQPFKKFSMQAASGLVEP